LANFNTPPGFATTNNPCEAMNSQIKKMYTCFENKCVLDSLKIMEKILQDTSISQNFDFILTKSRDNSINKLAKQYDPSCFTFAENLCYYKL